jgi:hypothetical protein
MRGAMEGLLAVFGVLGRALWEAAPIVAPVRIRGDLLQHRCGVAAELVGTVSVAVLGGGSPATV